MLPLRFELAERLAIVLRTNIEIEIAIAVAVADARIERIDLRS